MPATATRLAALLGQETASLNLQRQLQGQLGQSHEHCVRLGKGIRRRPFPTLSQHRLGQHHPGQTGCRQAQAIHILGCRSGA